MILYNKNIVQDLCKRFNITKYVEIEFDDVYCRVNSQESYINKSHIAGSDEIYIGLYTDDEIKFASLFFLLGLTMIKHKDKMKQVERYKLAWKKGLELAKEYDINFSLNTLFWAYDQIKTMVGWEEREITNYKSKYTYQEIENIIERNSKFYSIQI